MKNSACGQGIHSLVPRFPKGSASGFCVAVRQVEIVTDVVHLLNRRSLEHLRETITRSQQRFGRFTE